jgi:hypothetical protein
VRLDLKLNRAPAHDDFANARQLSGESATDESTNAEAGREPGEPTHWTSGGPSVWYRWIAPTTGRVTVDLTGSGFDTIAGVYTGSAVGSLTRVTSADAPELSFWAERGTTYSIAVDGKSGATGTLLFALDLTPAPANDDLADATELSGTSDTGTADNRGASTEPRENYWSGRTVWWRWTAPSTGTATVDLSDSDFDTALGIYAGSSYDDLAWVTGDTDGGAGDRSRVAWHATAGTTYLIVADSQSAGTGTVGLALSHVRDPDPVPEPPATEQRDPDPVPDPPATEQRDPDPEPEAHQEPPATPNDNSEPSAPSGPSGTEPSAGTSAPAPAAPSAPPAPSAPEQPAAPLSINASFPAQKLKSVLKSGLTGTLSCPRTTCAIEAGVSVDPATAKKLGVKAAGASPFSGAAVQANGATKVVLKPSKTAARKLAKLKSLKLTVRLTARGSDGQTATITRTITLKR